MGRLTSGGRVAFTGALFALAFAGLAFAGDLGRTAFGPASAGQYGPPKVTICHHVPPKTSRGRGPTRHRTIRVNRSALPAHLRHGDTLGACTTAQNRRRHQAKAHKKRFHKAAPRPRGKRK